MGSEVATIAAVETEHPAQNVVRAARTVTMRILVFYLGSIAVIVSHPDYAADCPNPALTIEAFGGATGAGAADV